MYEEVLNRALKGQGIGRSDMEVLMSLRDPKELEDLFDTASAVSSRNFGNKVFLYGFVYFSTYCRNNCTFCHYRRSHSMERYRKNADEIISLSQDLRDSGVDLVDLTMGEDPRMYENGCQELLDVLRGVDEAVDIPIMLSPGAVPKEMFPSIRDAGADWFACYQETHNRSLFQKLRIGQDYDHRRNQRTWARENGILTEDGIMIGIGETYADRIDSVMEMGRQGSDQVRVMTFVPQDGTPMHGMPPLNGTEELKTIAILRLAYPDRLIPASLDVEGIDGLIPRLRAGANVVTSIVPPNMKLAGVAQKELDIDSGKRSVPNVVEMLDAGGYRCAGNNDYVGFIKGRRGSVC